LAHRWIPSAGPSITEAEVRLVTEAVRDGWYENMNLHMDQFINEFSSYLEMPYCLPTANCTSAIHLALMALGVGPGDEVIVPDVTWVASAAPVHYVGARVVFADIDQDTWCLSPTSFEDSISSKTKAVVAVGLAGNLPDMDEIRRIADHHGVAIVEDAAESLGAEYKGHKAGTLGDIGVFSFNATKIMVAGQGGMIVTRDPHLQQRFKSLSHHGIKKGPGEPYFWSHELGYNYNWTNIQAALALAQLRRLEELLEVKRQAHGWYQERLGDMEGVRLNFEPEGFKATFWLNVAVVDPAFGIEKEKIQAELLSHNIDTRPFFYPISSMPPYAADCAGQDMAKVNSVSYHISPYAICLPSSFSLTEEEADYVCDRFKRVLGR